MDDCEAKVSPLRRQLRLQQRFQLEFRSTLVFFLLHFVWFMFSLSLHEFPFSPNADCLPGRLLVWGLLDTGGPRGVTLCCVHAVHALLCDVCGDNYIDSRLGQWTLLATVRLVGRHWAAVDTGTGAGHAHDHTTLGKWKGTCLNPRQQQLLNFLSSVSTGPAICARTDRADVVSDTPDYQLPGADLCHSHGH